MKAKERSHPKRLRARPRGRIRQALGSERGIALPVAVTVLLMAGLLAAAASTSALSANNQSNHDRGTKRAVAAADAGISVATHRLNALARVLTTAQPCPVVASGGQLQIEAVQADGWCRVQTDTLGGGGTYTYRTTPPVQRVVGGQTVWQREIVSTGVFRSVRRRAEAVVGAPTGAPLFDYAVFSQEDLTLKGAAKIYGNARSNGNIVTGPGAGSQVCGNATYGPSKQFRGGNQCAGYTRTEATEPYVLSPVQIPATNHNARISTGADPVSGRITWDASRRTLLLDANDRVTLNGGVYVFCKLELKNTARLIVPDDGTPVQIYLDTPDNCGGAGYGSVVVSDTARIENQSQIAANLQLYIAGSSRYPTTVNIQTAFDLYMLIYAPLTTVALKRNGDLVGAVLAKQVSMEGASSVTWDPSLSSFFNRDVPLPTYTQQYWVECTPQPTGSAPSSGC